MKKILIAAAIVCAAVCSQASVFNWSFSEKIDGSTGYKIDGASVYVLTTGDWGTFTGLTAAEKTLANLQGYALDSAALSQKGTTTIAYSATADSANKPTATWAEGLSNAQDLMFVVVTADAKSYAAKIGDAGAEAYTAGLGAEGQVGSLSISKGGAKTYVAGDFAAFAVPEPTSGLLLLLGMAGLALRRRRA